MFESCLRWGIIQSKLTLAFSWCSPWEKFNRNPSAPARNSFSIISKVLLAGPNVANCLVDFRQRDDFSNTWMLVRWDSSEAAIIGSFVTTRLWKVNRRAILGIACLRARYTKNQIQDIIQFKCYHQQRKLNLRTIRESSLQEYSAPQLILHIHMQHTLRILKL